MIFALLFFLFLITGIALYIFARKLGTLNSASKFMLGMGLSVALICVFIIVMLAAIGILAKSLTLLYGLLAVGLFQFIYITPLAIFLTFNRQDDIMRGLVTGAVMIAVINGAIFFVLPFIGKH